MRFQLGCLVILSVGFIFAEEDAGRPVLGCAGVVCPRRFEKCEVGQDGRPICVKNCPNCDPVINSAPVCGTDGQSYQSVCHVREVECMKGTIIDVACNGLCPCDPKEVEKMDPDLVHKLERMRLKVLRERRLDKELARESASVEAWQELNQNNKKNEEVKKPRELTKEEKLKKWNQLKEALKNEEALAKEEVLQEKMMQRRTKFAQDEGKVCQLSELQQLPSRLVDWFHVLKSSEMRKMMKASKSGEKGVLKELRFVDAKLRSLYVKLTCRKKMTSSDEVYCLEPVKWMFEYLDKDGDKRLNQKELSVVDNVSAENCVKPFFMGCDADTNGFIEQREFCKCLCVEPPCTKMMEEVPTILVKGIPQPAPGFFAPKCDEDGFFMPRQCHANKCWCVDRNGAAFKDTTKFITTEKDLPDCGIDNTDSSVMLRGETEYFDINKENREMREKSEP